jgi:hypothetical protein
MEDRLQDGRPVAPAQHRRRDPESLTQKAAKYFQAFANSRKMIHFPSWPGFVPAIHVFLT